MNRNFIRVRFPIATLAFATILALASCDSVVNIAGANFSAWLLLCVIVGAMLAAGFRLVFAASAIEPHLGPSPLIYPCLPLLLGSALYLMFFNRV
jgi:hypothetical protein